ncbi:hypothetical protein TIFTF001_044738 [Ficus carica]|uniref:Uncharacterized protein n=1 Tax=Ficus carica TaxID=3494 RepID=A0AA87Z9P6_FICCA|nr:hypothetical protein TIFTF001_044738 [Ficus carica]
MSTKSGDQSEVTVKEIAFGKLVRRLELPTFEGINPDKKLDRGQELGLLLIKRRQRPKRSMSTVLALSPRPKPLKLDLYTKLFGNPHLREKLNYENDDDS